jgi:hypothetical protein
MNFFFDANISWKICDMIAAFESGNHKVVHITKDIRFSRYNNKYGNSTPDTEYLEILGSDSVEWIVVSGDCNIVDTAHERAALLNSGLTFFALDEHWSKASAHEQAWKLVKIWNDIVRYASAGNHAIYRVNMGRKLGIEMVKSGMRVRRGKFRG